MKISMVNLHSDFSIPWWLEMPKHMYQDIISNTEYYTIYYPMRFVTLSVMSNMFKINIKQSHDRDKYRKSKYAE